MDKKFEKVVRRVGNDLIKQYESNKNISCGINGPYDDKETRVRNLCHLIIITSIEYFINKKVELINLLKVMADDLIMERNNEYYYVLREKAGKDNCNGVIGHSWIIEAYVYLYKVFKNEKYLNICKELSESHIFNYNLKLWYIPNNKNNYVIDFTYNHQLWYATSLLELNVFLKDSKIQNQLDCYFDNLSKISSNSLRGKISHSIYLREKMLDNLKQLIKKYINLFKEKLNLSSMKYKEEGYHLFNLMAFSRIYQLCPSLEIFETKFFEKSLNYLNSDTFLFDLEDNKFYLDASLKNSNISNNEKAINVYGYPYNVPGFEIDYINATFEGKINKSNMEKIKNNQIKYTYNEKDNRFGKNCHDSNTINYRIYEYYRYLEKKYEKNM